MARHELAQSDYYLTNLSLLQGFIPNFARIGSFNIVLWLSYEQIKKLQI